MANYNDRFIKLEQRIKELEGYLSQFESFKNYRRRDRKNNTAAIATPPVPTIKNKSKGTRLQEDWMPDVDLVTWVHKEFPFVDIQLETAKFIDYWVSRADNGAIKLSWERTYRNWIRTASTSYKRVNHATHQRTDKFDFTTAVKTSFDDHLQ